MNHIYRSIWSEKTGTFVAVSENTNNGGKSATGGGGVVVGAGFVLKALAASLLMAFGGQTLAGPVGGVVVAGSATIGSGAGTTTITQGSQNVALNWQSFNIAKGEAVNFVQPNSQAVALNRVLGADPSSILGSLSANGKVFLVNPNGILFGRGASVNVGGLVASTLNLSDSDFLAGRYKFSGTSSAAVRNEGSINADGGYVALLGAAVSNQGTINARLGTVALAAGTAITLDVAGDGLINVSVERGALDALVENGGLVQADGGQVLLTAQAAGDLLHTAVNNSGVIQAHTIEEHQGGIRLLGDMQSGTVTAGGTLDASAPQGGNGGFIETSAARVKMADELHVTTSAAKGATGRWLIDPQDYTIAAAGGDITGAQLATQLLTTDVIIESVAGHNLNPGAGDIHINDSVSWSANKLTLNAQNNINVNANLNASADASLALEFGQQAAYPHNASRVVFTGGTINLPAGTSNFTTRLGVDGPVKAYTVLTSLGQAGSATGTDLQGMQPYAPDSVTSVNYVLGADIDASATAGWLGGAGFMPFSRLETTFDGLGHTISNLTINRQTSGRPIGMFGEIDRNAVVQNLRLVGASITGNLDDMPQYRGEVGIVAGRNFGTIHNVEVSGVVTGAANVGGLVGSNRGIVSDSRATGTVTGASSVGGLAGGSNGTITNSHALAVVTGDSHVGGLVGANSNFIEASDASGAVSGSWKAGGLVGSNDGGTILNSAASGNVSGGGGDAIGGLVGSSAGGSISTSHATGTVTAPGNGTGVGGLVGQMISGTINTSYATGTVTATGADVGGLIGAMHDRASLVNSYATGDVISSGNNAGGLVGLIDGDQGGQLFTVLNSTVSASYSAGNVIGRSNVGGIVGTNYGVVDTVYAVGAVTGVSNVGAMAGEAKGNLAGVFNSSVNPGLGAAGAQTDNITVAATGLTSGQMQTASNFVGFVFTSTPGAIGNNWVLVDGAGSLNNSAGAFGATRPMLASEYATRIGNAHQLQLMAMNLTASYTLANNIDASASGRSGADVWGSAGFVPIKGAYFDQGTCQCIVPAPFAGSFDGIGHTISGLTIRQAGDETGLFGRLQGGTVQNVGLVGASVSGAGSVGGLVGYNDSGAISNSYVSGTVAGVSAVGGLVGTNAGTITGSYATGAVSGSEKIGGMVGINAGIIRESYANAAVHGNERVGGLAGENASVIIYSYASGAVSGDNAVGGFAGTNNGTVANNYWDISASGQSSSTSAQSSSAAGTGLTTAQMRTAASFEGFQFTSIPGAMGNQWVMVDVDGTLNNAGGALGATRPMLASEYASTINNVHQLQLVSMNLTTRYVLANDISAAATGAGKDVWLGSGFVPLGNADKKFTGSLYGGDRTIGALTINRPGIENTGLFGYLGKGAIVQNLRLAAVNISGGEATGALAGRIDEALVTGSGASGVLSGSDQNVGGLVGYSDHGSISNSDASVSVTGVGANIGGLIGAMQGGVVDRSFADGTVGSTVGNEASRVGGLVGANLGGAIGNSYASGAASGLATVGGLVGISVGGTINNSYASGTASGYTIGNNRDAVNNIGGLVGLVSGGALSNVYATGNASGGSAVGGLVGTFARGTGLATLTNSYASGTVSGTSTVGGLVGGNFGTISNSYFDSTVNPSLEIAAINMQTIDSNSRGLTSTQMRDAASFTGFAFSTQPGATGNAWVLVNVDGTLNNRYEMVGATRPMLASEYTTRIGNAHQLQLMNMNLDASYTLANNINAAATGTSADVWFDGGFVPVGGRADVTLDYRRFQRSFDGLGHTISGLTISRPERDSVGLFGWLGTGAIVQNVGLVGGSMSAAYNTGALAGQSKSAMLSNTSSSAAVSGVSEGVGGLVGYSNGGAVYNSHASGTVSGTSRVGGLLGIVDSFAVIANSSASGSVSGQHDGIGGLIGAVDSSFLINSHATGAVIGGGDQIGGLVGYGSQSTIDRSDASGAVSGSGTVGGLMGYNRYGVVSNSHASGTVSGAQSRVGGLIGDSEWVDGAANVTTISNSYASGAVTGASEVGGLLGNNTLGNLNNTYASGAVTATGVNAGGLVGHSQSGSISNSYATGAVAGNDGVGGLVGRFDGQGGIYQTYASGAVSSIGAVAGGLVGSATEATIQYGYWNADGFSGNGVGEGDVSGTSGLTSSAMLTYGNFTGFNFIDTHGASVNGGNDWVLVNVDGTLNNSNSMLGATRPMLASEYATTISNAHQLQLMSMDLGAQYTLAKDIDAAGTGRATDVWSDTFVPVGGQAGKFTGSFDGQGHTISGLTITRPKTDYAGLFGQAGDGAIVRNVDLVGLSVTGRENTGGLVGLLQSGTISNSTVSGLVKGGMINVGGLVGNLDGSTVSNSHANVAVTGTSNVGGLLGTVDGSTIDHSGASGAVEGSNNVAGLAGYLGASTLSSSHASGTVGGQENVGGLIGQNYSDSAVSTSYASGAVSGMSNVGGLVGKNDGSVRNSYAAGTVNAQYQVGGLIGTNQGTISNTYATGAVNGNYQVGGLVGNHEGQISNSYSTGAVIGAHEVGGLVGTNNGSVSGSFWDTTTSGQINSAGVVGMSTADMHSLASFTAREWDLTSTWIIYDGHTAPLLRSFMTALTVSAVNVSKSYDGLTYAGNNGVRYSTATDGRLLGLDGISYTGNAQGAKNAGGYGISASGLYSTQDGYAITYADGVLAVNKSTLTGIASASNKAYDGNTSADVGFAIVAGLAVGETLHASGTGTFNSKDVAGANLVTVNSTILTNGNNGLASNYRLASGQKAQAYITPKELTATATAPDKVYDGNAVATASLEMHGLVGTEMLASTNSASFITKDVSTLNGVIVDSITLSDGVNGINNGLVSNYSLASGQTAVAKITAKELTATATALNKVYDGNTVATASLNLLGLVDGETLASTTSASFNSKNVLAASAVTVNGITLADGVNGINGVNNGLASNYSLASGQTAVAKITAKELTATATALNKVYDGNTVATASLNLLGLVDGETLASTNSASFNSKNVLAASAVTVNGITLVDGVNGINNGLASNYSLASGQTAVAKITAKELTATATALNKVYDGNTVATASLNLLGLVDGETLSSTNSASFNSKNVLAASAVTVNGITLVDGVNGINNGLASNYSLASGQTAVAKITAKELMATATALNKVYDGNAVATASLSLLGLVDGETLASTNSASFNSRNVLAASAVTVNGITLVDGVNGINNGLASNYSLASGQTAVAKITAKELMATATALNKVYDGNAVATASLSLLGLVDGETLASTNSASFNSKNVLAASAVTVNGITLADGVNGVNGVNNGLASNYSLASGQTAVAKITAKELMATATALNKVYDGNAVATASLSLLGLVDGETLSSTNSASFNSKNVLAASAVTVNGITLVDGVNGVNNGLASNYSLASGQTAVAKITAKELTATATALNKVYDGNTVATASLSLLGLVDGETLASTNSASFNSKNVLAASAVTVNGITLADGVNGVNNGLASNYSLASGQTAVAKITAKELTATATALNKVYDGNTVATASLNLLGLVDGETLSSTNSASFNSKNVLAASAVTVNGITLVDGVNGINNGLASNYSLASGQTAVAKITAKELTATATALNKVYDGNAVATASLNLLGLVDGETLASTTSASFNSKNVLAASAVTVNGITLADGVNGVNNGLASNYSLASGQTAVAKITAKELTATATALNKVYDGNAVATASLSLLGLVDGETLSSTNSASFNSKNVLAASAVTVNGITLVDGVNGINNGLASNYSLASGQTAAATIAAKALTATAGASNKTYDGTTTAAAILGITGGLVGTETVGATGAATFNSKDVLSANVVTVNSTALADGSNGGLASNYSLASGQTAAATIAAKALTATAGASNKTYDGTTTASAGLTVASGLVGTETVTATGAATFNSKDVLSANVVTVNSTALADGSNGGLASNYSLASGQTAAATIAAKALTATAGASNKTYDGTTTAAAILGITGGLVGTETVGATGAATFNSKDVLSAKLVTVNSTALADGSNGGLASNYSLASGQTAAATIAAKALTATAGASNKTYDGTTAASAGLTVAGGLVGTETVTATGAATFNSKDVLNAKLVTVNSTALADGSNGGLASNYSLASGQTAAATIAAKALTATAGASNKTYDGTSTAAAILGITGGLVANETVTATGGATFNSKDVLSANLVTVNSTALADGSNGGLASNYRLASGQTAAATIAAKALTATAGASNKTYDGTTTAAAILGITGGLVGTETVTATGDATFNSKDVLNANRVTVNGTVLSNGSNGGLASNYSLASGQTAAATIAAKALTATAGASNKTYDGTTTAAAILGITGGLVGTETVTATGDATFNSKDVLNANRVTVNGTVLSNGSNGGLASNYSLASGQTAAATIAAKALTATAGASNKTYDGTTTAAAILGITGGLVGTETVTATGDATFNSKDVLNANRVTVNGTVLSNGSNGGLASNYSLASGQTAAATIAAKALTATAGASNKTYDGTTTAAAILGITDGLVGTETVTATGGATFNSKDVLTANLVTINSTVLAEGSNGGLASNYSLASGQTAAATIAAKALTATAGASNKTYDGTTTAAAILGITGGLVANEIVTATGGATFNSKDVLSGNLVTVNSTALADGSNGGLASNYSLASGQTAAATIAAKALTATAGAANKTYDGNTTAAAILGITGGLVGTETVTATGDATFNSKDVLNANRVTVSGTVLSNGSNGGLASNYSLASGQTAAATIAAKALTATAGAANKTYDGNTTAAAILGITGGLVGTETVTATGDATFNSKDVLNANRVTVSGTVLSNGSNGGLASNYSLASGQTAAATIAAKALMATAGASNKTYDGSAIAIAGLTVASGLVGTETVTATGAATFNSKDVLTANLVTVNSTALADGSNGGLASNYSLASGQTAAATIAAKALTATAGASNKTYDGTTTAAAILGITGGLVGTETVTATGAATFNSKDVLSANLVTVNGTALADGSNGGLASNYSLASGQTAAATIAAKSLTATAGALSKTYDGTTTAAAILGITGGLVGTETVSATGAATFNSKDVLGATQVTVNSTALADGSNGGLASNYSLTSGQTAAATIAAKTLTATAGASNKTYDGTTTAAAIVGITGGLVGTETVSATGSATFNSKDVLNANLVTVNSTALADGSNGGLASNYSLASGQTAAATIAPKALTI
ncbi:YDG domain-containing protein, partial [Massilia sp. DWR3-1-1]|uniref:YDG domain-containing protein n=1 Tax=Massilia sp. DWR3-1-1 TaxID=2804559 RepID=UPI003CE7A74F